MLCLVSAGEDFLLTTFTQANVSTNSVPNDAKISLDTIKKIASEIGFHVLGALRLVEAKDRLALEKSRLIEWQRSGFAASMSYMERNPDLFLNPSKLLPETSSILTLAIPYSSFPHMHSSSIATSPSQARIALYARGRDYHNVIKKRLKSLVAIVSQYSGRTVNARFFSDAVPILEKPLAEAAGLGFIGKNTLLIRPKIGSFFFLSEILWDVELDIECGFRTSEKTLTRQITSGRAISCGTCQRCLLNCPTGALKRAGVLDPRLCISYLTIEHKGAFSTWQRSAIGSWLFGCDQCQDVCPFNCTGMDLDLWPEFRDDAGVGQILELEEILLIRSQEEFRDIFEGTPLMRAGREHLLRNAAAVLGNNRCSSLIPLLREVAQNDESILVRGEAQAALLRF